MRMITLVLFDEAYQNQASITFDPLLVESASASRKRIAWGGVLDVVTIRMRSGDEHVVYGNQATIDQIASVKHPFIHADPHFGDVAAFDANWKQACGCGNGCEGWHLVAKCKIYTLREFLKGWRAEGIER